MIFNKDTTVMNDSFQFIMPAEISKSDDGDWKIAGLASTEAVDKQGEIILQKGVDLTPIKEKQGYFNFDHDNSVESLIGVIDGYNQSKEGLYVHGRLFKNHTKAKAVYEIMSSLTKADKGRCGLSVEGRVLARDPKNPKIITKCQIKNVAVTFSPVNSNTYADLVKSMSGASIDFNCSKDENSDNIATTTQELPTFTATQVVEIVEKALTAGAAGTKAPVERTGGEALAQSDMPEEKEDPKKALESDENDDEVAEIVEEAKTKKLKKGTQELFKSNIIEILDRLQKLYPNNTRLEILEAVRERLETKFPEIKNF